MRFLQPGWDHHSRAFVAGYSSFALLTTPVYNRSTRLCYRHPEQHGGAGRARSIQPPRRHRREKQALRHEPETHQSEERTEEQELNGESFAYMGKLSYSVQSTKTRVTEAVRHLACSVAVSPCGAGRVCAASHRVERGLAMVHQSANGSNARPTSLIPFALIMVFLAAVSSCSDRGMPTAIHSPGSSNRQIQLTDWYSCWKYEGDTQWRSCEYTGTTGDENSGSWVNFLDPVYYTSLQQVSVTQTPSAMEPEPQPYLPRFDDQDSKQSSTIPDCNYPDDLDSRDLAWCNGKDVAGANGDHHRLPAVQAALRKMAALGPPCDVLANEMSQVVGSHNLKFYHPDPSGAGYQGGGFASAGMHGAGYVLLEDKWVDDWYDEHKYGITWTVVNGVRQQVKQNLQFVLAHEADHLHNAALQHLDPKPSGKAFLTENAIHCGGLGS